MSEVIGWMRLESVEAIAFDDGLHIKFHNALNGLEELMVSSAAVVVAEDGGQVVKSCR